MFVAVQSYLDCTDIDTEEKKERLKEYKNTIDILVEKGANVNTQNKEGQTILNYINQSGKDCPDLVKQLKDKDAKTSGELNTKWQDKVSQEPDLPGRAGGGGPGL